MVKVLLVTNIPTPYRIPLFNELNKQLAEAGVGFKVAFAVLGYSRRKWAVDMTECQFDHVVLRSRSIVLGGKGESTLFTYRGLHRIIRAYSPTVIIVSGFSIATMKVWLLSLLGKTKYLIWSGSVARKGRLDSRVRLWLRRSLAKRAVGAVAYGSKAKAYLQSLGIAAQDIHIAVNTVDTEFFRDRTKKRRGYISSSEGTHRLLYIGHLTKGKRIDLLFHVVKQLGRLREDFCLNVIGEGPEEGALRRLAEQLQIESLVSFEGFKQREELPKYLARATCFVFPSEYDIWGLVLVEAMAAGVPCIASIHAGATHDLIEDGVTGFPVDFADTKHVVEKVTWLLENPEGAAQMGQWASRYVADQVTLERSARGFVEAIRHCLR